jgi:phage shock protein B
MEVFKFVLVLVPTILFMIIVLPTWLVMHYRYKNKTNRGLDEDDQATLDDLLRTLDTMADRIEALESILDDRNSRWRRDADSE